MEVCCKKFQLTLPKFFPASEDSRSMVDDELLALDIMFTVQIVLFFASLVGIKPVFLGKTIHCRIGLHLLPIILENSFRSRFSRLIDL